MKAKLETMKPEERHCALLIDEMQLTAGLDFDPTVKKPIGLATAPLVKQGPEGELVYATHGLVVMLTGLSSRWKQVVAYHFTGKCNLLTKILSKQSFNNTFAVDTKVVTPSPHVFIFNKKGTSGPPFLHC